MNEGGLAVVGSREIGEDLVRYSEDVGALSAQALVVVVSGDARGVDQAAMRGATSRGGRAVGVLGSNLAWTSRSMRHRQSLMDGRLTLVSPFDPEVGFRGWRAMARNKLIFALADAALVVNSALKGGTWGGATEQLDKLGYVPVYVRSQGARSDGLDALLERGASAWPEPATPEKLEGILTVGLNKV